MNKLNTKTKLSVGPKNYLLLTSFFIFFISGIQAQCVFTGFDFSSSDPLSHCSGNNSISIEGDVLIDNYWNISSYSATVIDINGGQVLFDADYTWNLPLNATLLLTNGGGIAYSGGNNVNKAIAFGGTVIATANGGGGTYTFAEVITSGGMNAQGPLPVDLVRFDARKMGISTVLEWETALELNNEKFIVEHSTDGKNYESIAVQRGAGTTLIHQAYEYVHLNPNKGLNYYRLIQKDFNGEQKYSSIKTVEHESDQSWRLVNTIAQDVIQISLDQELSTSLTISIFNVAGQKLMDHSVLENSNHLELDIKHLPKGTYLMRFSDGRSISTQRFIKN